MNNYKKKRIRVYVGCILSLFMLFSIIPLKEGTAKASDSNESRKKL